MKIRCDVVFSKNTAVVLQYFDYEVVKRVIIPENELDSIDKKEVFVEKSILDQGISYGFPVSSIFGSITITGEELENELHKAGLWTAEEIASDSSAVLSAIQSTFRLTYGTLIKAIVDHLSKEE